MNKRIRVDVKNLFKLKIGRRKFVLNCFTEDPVNEVIAIKSKTLPEYIADELKKSDVYKASSKQSDEARIRKTVNAYKESASLPYEMFRVEKKTFTEGDVVGRLYEEAQKHMPTPEPFTLSNNHIASLKTIKEVLKYPNLFHKSEIEELKKALNELANIE